MHTYLRLNNIPLQRLSILPVDSDRGIATELAELRYVEIHPQYELDRNTVTCF